MNISEAGHTHKPHYNEQSKICNIARYSRKQTWHSTLMTAEALWDWQQQQRRWSCTLSSSTRSVCIYTTFENKCCAQQLESTFHHTSHFDNGIHRVSPPPPLYSLDRPLLETLPTNRTLPSRNNYCVACGWASHLRMLIHSSSEWPTVLH